MNLACRLVSLYIYSLLVFFQEGGFACLRLACFLASLLACLLACGWLACGLLACMHACLRLASLLVCLFSPGPSVCVSSFFIFSPWFLSALVVYSLCLSVPVCVCFALFSFFSLVFLISLNGLLSALESQCVLDFPFSVQTCLTTAYLSRCECVCVFLNFPVFLPQFFHFQLSYLLTVLSPLFPATLDFFFSLISYLRFFLSLLSLSLHLFLD